MSYDDIEKFITQGTLLLGTQDDRQKMVDYVCSCMEGYIERQELYGKYDYGAGKWIENIRKMMFREKEDIGRLQNFALHHPGLRDDLSGEVLSEFESSVCLTSSDSPDCPFYAEGELIKEAREKAESNIEGFFEALDGFKDSLGATDTGGDNTVDFDFYRGEYDRLRSAYEAESGTAGVDDAQDVEISQEEYFKLLKALLQKFFNDLEKSFSERYLNETLKMLDKLRRSFQKRFYGKMDAYAGIEGKIGPMIEAGLFWDLSSGKLDDYGFRLIQDYLSKLENDKSLKELCDMIGRAQCESDKWEQQIISQDQLNEEYCVSPAYKGQVSGLKLDDDISSVQPSELAMRKNPTTRMYFNQKFAEKKLLSYSYQNQMKRMIADKNDVVENVRIKDRKGPAIICLDTSGSMMGLSETVAKTVCLAIASKCLRERRECYLISFSTEITVKDFSYCAGRSGGAEELLDFLKLSFNGGTDAVPALRKCLELLQERKWHNADVLAISDFIMGDFGAEVEGEIKKQQELKTRFWSLAIGSSGNKEVINVFDETWKYNLDRSGESLGRLVRNLKSRKLM